MNVGSVFGLGGRNNGGVKFWVNFRVWEPAQYDYADGTSHRAVAADPLPEPHDIDVLVLPSRCTSEPHHDAGPEGGEHAGAHGGDGPILLAIGGLIIHAYVYVKLFCGCW